MSQPRVLVVGGHVYDNQFTRKAKDAGAIVEWHNGNPGKSFPHFCDALICAKFQLSHEGFWAAKEAYKGKPTFIADHSWSTIKERFEDYIEEFKASHPPKQTIIRKAMEKAVQQTNSVAQTKAILATQLKREFPYSDEQRKKILDALIDLAHLSPKNAAIELTGAGITRSDGKPFAAMDVNNWRSSKGYKNLLRPLTTTQKKSAVDSSQTKAKPSRDTDKLVYELILSANLGAVETTSLMRRCMDGRLTQNEALKFIELYSDLKAEGAK